MKGVKNNNKRRPKRERENIYKFKEMYLNIEKSKIMTSICVIYINEKAVVEEELMNFLIIIIISSDARISIRFRF